MAAEVAEEEGEEGEESEGEAGEATPLLAIPFASRLRIARSADRSSHAW